MVDERNQRDIGTHTFYLLWLINLTSYYSYLLAYFSEYNNLDSFYSTLLFVTYYLRFRLDSKYQVTNKECKFLFCLVYVHIYFKTHKLLVSNEKYVLIKRHFHFIKDDGFTFKETIISLYEHVLN